MEPSKVRTHDTVINCYFLFFSVCTVCVWKIQINRVESHHNLSPPCRHFFGEVWCWVWERLWSLLPGIFLPLVGSDLSWSPLSAGVVLSSRISVWTSARYSTHHQGSARVWPLQSLHFTIFFLLFFSTQCLVTYSKSGFQIELNILTVKGVYCKIYCSASDFRFVNNFWQILAMFIQLKK